MLEGQALERQGEKSEDNIFNKVGVNDCHFQKVTKIMGWNMRFNK